jgi:hypothetical protein
MVALVTLVLRLLHVVPSLVVVALVVVVLVVVALVVAPRWSLLSALAGAAHAAPSRTARPSAIAASSICERTFGVRAIVVFMISLPSKVI